MKPPHADPGSITRVAGIEVGHFTDARRPTGCTAILARAGAVAGVDVRGAAPGTRETDLLAPGNLVEQIHAIVLSGGSAFGLDAAGGAMRWLEEHSIGLDVGVAHVPIVPAAVLFDLMVGDPAIRPDAAAGYAACAAASANDPEEGNVGAGAGAAVGKLFGMQRAMKGGIGSASVTVGDITVGALIACNAVGDVIDADTAQVVAGARTADGLRLLNSRRALLRGELPRRCCLAPTPRLASSPPMPGSPRPRRSAWLWQRTTAWPAAFFRPIPNSTVTPCLPWAPAPRASRPACCCLPPWPPK